MPRQEERNCKIKSPMIDFNQVFDVKLQNKEIISRVQGFVLSIFSQFKISHVPRNTKT